VKVDARQCRLAAGDAFHILRELHPVPIPTRRDFLRFSLRAGAACAGLGFLARRRLAAIEPIARPGHPRFKLSLVAYSFRRYLTEKDPAKKITVFDFVDYCADQGFSAAELTGYYFPQPPTEEWLNTLKRHAYLRGVAVSGTATRSDFAQLDRAKLDEQIDSVKSWVRNAAVLGAPYLRVFAAHGEPMREAGNERACIAGLEECADYAGTKGIFLGLENDGGLSPDLILSIVRGVKSPWFGLNLDLQNFHTSDVYGDLARCAPYAVNVHFKRSIQPAGRPSMRADIPRMLRILSNANYQGYLAFEYEDDEDPYQAIPPWKKDVVEALKLANLG
jgi:sugar phosphate isomerase/epimerase